VIGFMQRLLKKAPKPGENILSEFPPRRIRLLVSPGKNVFPETEKESEKWYWQTGLAANEKNKNELVK